MAFAWFDNAGRFHQQKGGNRDARQPSSVNSSAGMKMLTVFRAGIQHWLLAIYRVSEVRHQKPPPVIMLLGYSKPQSIAKAIVDVLGNSKS